jgi:sterol desaturase/sphingolipid hydroxylase (fatty acid hydroxylase superfamily)
MHLDNTLLYPALTAIIILTAAETVYMMKEHRHDNKDMLSSIGLALGRVPVSAITKGIVIYTYTLIYQYRFFTIPANYWWAWVICFFSDDFSFYWFHRLSHQIRFLWASHMVHHSSEKFTLSSGLRVPWTSDLTGNFLFWAWMPLIGIEPYMIIFMKSANVLYQFWMHTESIRKLPKWFEAVFNTPSHHRVHHGSDVEYLDKNHAGTLIIWDKLFGTYQEEIFKPKYGLTEDVKSVNPFVIAFHEWKNILRDLKKAKNIRDGLLYCFKPPGWSHDGATKTTRQLQSELKASKTGSDLTSFNNII